MKHLFLFFLLAVFLSSCVDQFDFSMDKLSTTIEQKTALAVPLINTSVSIEKVFDTKSNDKMIIIDNEGFITLEYEYEVGTFPAPDFFNNQYGGPGVILPPLSYNVDPIKVDLGVDKIVNEGKFYIASPKIEISIKNYWDIPVRFRFQDFFYYPKENSSAAAVQGTAMTKWYKVDPPVAPAQYAITKITLDTANSNIDDVISILPHHMTAGAYMETITNPPVTYSVNPNSVDSVSMKITVPLDLLFYDIAFRDTIETSLGKDLGSDTSTVESVELSMKINNGFPFGMATQIYFTDDKYKILDSISTTGIIVNPANVGNDGKVSGSVESDIKISVEGKRKNNLLNAKYLLPVVGFATKDANLGKTVKIYNNYELALKLGALVKLKLKTN